MGIWVSNSSNALTQNLRVSMIFRALEEGIDQVEDSYPVKPKNMSVNCYSMGERGKYQSSLHN